MKRKPMRSLRQSRKGLSSIMAEVFMVVIVLIMSSIIFVWVTPVFTSNQNNNYNQYAYLESFKTVQGNYVYSTNVGTEDTRAPPNGPWTPNTLCTTSINTPFTGNILVPSGATCTITAKITGNVYINPTGSLTVNNTSITGTLIGNFPERVTIINTAVGGDLGMYNPNTVNITGGSVGGNLYIGNRGYITMTGTTVAGNAEFEVNQAATIIGNTIGGELEAEAVGTALVMGNTASHIDDDGNGAAVITGNTIGSGGISYGADGWCASSGNTVTGGATSGTCTGQVTVNLVNTGSIPVTIRSIYVDRSPSTGISWTLGPGASLQCGSTVQTTPCSQLPVVVPVRQAAQITLVWTPPSTGIQMVGLAIPIKLVSSYSNFVDVTLYLGSDLTTTSQSRPLSQTCPPCN